MMRRYIYLIIILLIIVGCGRRPPPMLVCYCTETFYPEIVESTRTFYSIYKIPIFVVMLRPPDQMHQDEEAPEPLESQDWFIAAETVRHEEEIDPTLVVPAPIIAREMDVIEASGVGDIFITDYPEELVMLRERGLIHKEQPICELALKFIVKEGNPDEINSIQALLAKHLRIGILNPTWQGCGSVSLSMLAHYRFPAERKVSDVIAIYNRQSELEEALQSGEVSGILLWDILLDPEKKIGEVLDIPSDPPSGTNADAGWSDRVKNLSYHPIRSINLITLSCSEHDRYVARFVDFLRSEQAKNKKTEEEK